MRTFGIKVTRDGRFWLIEVPEIEQFTQARNRGEIELMARELISLCLDVSIGDVAVRIMD